MRHGIKKPKRHGNWMALPLNGDFFLEMDSWSNSIHLRRGDLADFNEFTGWPKARSQIWYGSDFGGYEPHTNAAALEETISSAETAIARGGR